MQQQASSVPTPSPEDYCCWKNLFVPARLECLSSSTSFGNTEPKVNGTTEQWNTTGIPHSQSPTGLLKVEVTRDIYPHYCIPGVFIFITQPKQVLVVGPLVTGQILFLYLWWKWRNTDYKEGFWRDGLKLGFWFTASWQWSAEMFKAAWISFWPLGGTFDM